MSKPTNYSKWDKIELSDDESDCHPNIDKQSWFRMKHRSRLEREEKEDIEMKKFEVANKEAEGRLAVINARLAGLKSGVEDEDAEFEDVEALAVEAVQLKKLIAERKKQAEDWMERRKWNIDNICKTTEEKTVVNSKTSASLKAEDFTPTGVTAARLEAGSATTSSTLPTPPPATATTTTTTTTTASISSTAASPAATTSKSAASSTAVPAVGPVEPPSTSKSIGSGGSKAREKFAVISYNDYVLGCEQLLEEYSEIRDLGDTEAFLFKHCDILLHEHAQSYMLLSCLEDEMNGKHNRMKLVCRQSQILSHITELGMSMGRDPRDVIVPFFRRISEKAYVDGFLKAVEDFKVRIQKRAVEKRREMDRDRIREERGDVPLGPGGLDPYEVLASLPEELQAAFDSQDINQLQATLARMDPKVAKDCMKRCVDSGLWVPSDSSIFTDDEDADDAKTPITANAAAIGAVSASDDIE